LVQAKVFYAQSKYKESTEEAKQALEMAEAMKSKDNILIGEIKQFLHPARSIKVPVAVSVIAMAGLVAGIALSL
jgi:hypothetical protein